MNDGSNDLPNDMLTDLRYAFRQLRKAPAFTLTALATIALCLGANLAIFAVIDSILLRPLPFPQSDRLVSIYNTYPKAGVENDGSSLTNYYERRGHIPALASLSMFMERAETVGDPGSTSRSQSCASRRIFSPTLGVGPAIGRDFTEQESAAQNNVVILRTPLAPTFRFRSKRARPDHHHQWDPPNGDRRSASVFSFSLLGGAHFSPAEIRRRRAGTESAPLRRWRHTP